MIPHHSETALYPLKASASLKHKLRDNSEKVLVAALVLAPWVLAAGVILCRNGWGGF